MRIVNSFDELVESFDEDLALKVRKARKIRMMAAILIGGVIFAFGAVIVLTDQVFPPVLSFLMGNYTIAVLELIGGIGLVAITLGWYYETLALGKKKDNK